MDFALPYLIGRFFYRIGEFLRHWYVKSAFMYTDFVFSALRRMDRTLAWRITLRHVFKPLYGDYSLIGYVVGFVFRIFRLVFGGIIYLIVFAVAIAAYLVWLLIPPLLILSIFLK